MGCMPNSESGMINLKNVIVLKKTYYLSRVPILHIQICILILCWSLFSKTFELCKMAMFVTSLNIYILFFIFRGYNLDFFRKKTRFFHRKCRFYLFRYILKSYFAIYVLWHSYEEYLWLIVYRLYLDFIFHFSNIFCVWKLSPHTVVSCQ